MALSTICAIASHRGRVRAYTCLCMGSMENDVRGKRRKDHLQYTILAAVGVTGILAVAAVAPNTLQLLGKVTGNRRFPYQARSVVSRLAAKRYVRFITGNGKKY